MNVEWCASCGGFMPSGDMYRVEDIDDIDRLDDLGRDILDQCGRHGTAWNFCSQCYTAVSRRAVPKFSVRNSMNVSLCQEYPPALEDLTFVEECLIIARCHPLGFVIKLRPDGRPASVNYYALKGHMIVLPTDL
ncbi:hypothetical protein V8E54_009919 [Elaphomyces granulatus]